MHHSNGEKIKLKEVTAHLNIYKTIHLYLLSPPPITVIRIVFNNILSLDA